MIVILVFVSFVLVGDVAAVLIASLVEPFSKFRQPSGISCTFYRRVLDRLAARDTRHRALFRQIAMEPVPQRNKVNTGSFWNPRRT